MSLRKPLPRERNRAPATPYVTCLAHPRGVLVQSTLYEPYIATTPEDLWEVVQEQARRTADASAIIKKHLEQKRPTKLPSRHAFLGNLEDLL